MCGLQTKHWRQKPRRNTVDCLTRIFFVSRRAMAGCLADLVKLRRIQYQCSSEQQPNWILQCMTLNINCGRHVNGSELIIINHEIIQEENDTQRVDTSAHVKIISLRLETQADKITKRSSIISCIISEFACRDREKTLTPSRQDRRCRDRDSNPAYNSEALVVDKSSM